MIPNIHPPCGLSRIIAGTKADISVAWWKLGQRHLHGFGLPQDPQAAAEAFFTAGELGFTLAYRSLASLIESGVVSPIGYDSLISLYSKAAEGCDHISQLRLGQLYREGKLVRQDVTKAKAYLRQSWSNGNSEAACTLAEIETVGSVSPDTPSLQQATSSYAISGPLGLNRLVCYLTDICPRHGKKNHTLAFAIG
jgi:TPR repeat protein